MAKSIMLQGTGSDVGKTVLVAGLCRLAANCGLKVKPFKPQNMSNNAAIADADGVTGEIGRGQWLQAIAARQSPSVHMNPVLLKPQSDQGSQVVVHGKVWGDAKAKDYRHLRSDLLNAVLESYDRLKQECDLVLVEGAGSPAEINLRDGDIANMGFATEADVPVVLVGDIHRGGVIASIVGTHHILPDHDRNMIKAYLINKFRGDVSLFDEGLTAITDFTQWPSLGVIPWLDAAGKLPEEDSVALERAYQTARKPVTIAVPKLPRIANFDDFDPLLAEEHVAVHFIGKDDPLPDHVSMIILPGSKSTMSDLAYLRAQGWDDMLKAHVNQGKHVMGICGGFQMLGRKIYDPDQIEGTIGEMDGFGLLDIETVIAPEKVTQNVNAHSIPYNTPLSGYEIHMGRTKGPDCQRPFSMIGAQKDGAISADGLVSGTYLHGAFACDAFRHAFLKSLGGKGANLDYRKSVDDALNALADELARHIDMDQLLKIAH